MHDIGRTVAWLAFSIALAVITATATGQSAAVTPKPLRALELARAIERSRPGVLSLETWLALDALLADAQSRESQRVRPAEAALWRKTIPQYWLNWPALKPASDRALQEAVLDAQREIDREFFTAAAGSAPPALRIALERVSAERVRSALGAWPLLDAAPIDLSIAVSRALGSDVLAPDCRARIDAELEAWSVENAALLLALHLERRRTFDRFELRLADIGIDLASLSHEDTSMMVRAFDIWEEISVPLAGHTRNMLALQDRALDRIAGELTPLRASWMRDAILSLTYRQSDRANRAFAARHFDRALRVQSLTEEQRRAIADRREQWCLADAALLERWCKEHAASAPAYCPLTYSHFGPDDRYRTNDAARADLTNARLALSHRALDGLRALLGPDADVLDGNDDAVDPRLTEAAPIGPLADAIWQRDERPWTPREPASLFRATWPRRGVFEQGTITATEAASLSDWIGLDPNARAAWLEALALLTAELQVPAPTGMALTGWSFNEEGYRFDRAKAEGVLRDSTTRLARLREAEHAWFLLAESLAEGAAAQRRVRFAAAAREMQVLLQPIVDATRDARLSLRAEAHLATALLDGFLLQPDRRDEVDGFIAATEPQWSALHSTTRARFDATLPEVQRSFALADEAMWLRGAAANTIARTRAEQRALLLAVDAPHRATMLTAIDAWRSAVRRASSGEEDRIFARAELLYEAQAFPLVMGADPSVVARIQADLASFGAHAAAGDASAAETCAALRALREWHQGADAALIAVAAAVCDGPPESGSPQDSQWQEHVERLHDVRSQREELADRAEVRRRLILRSVD